MYSVDTLCGQGGEDVKDGHYSLLFMTDVINIHIVTCDMCKMVEICGVSSRTCKLINCANRQYLSLLQSSLPISHNQLIMVGSAITQLLYSIIHLATGYNVRYMSHLSNFDNI